jgi:glyoxylase-like metal-dependent hydrolase (beta-lactamase superfamily II)
VSDAGTNGGGNQRAARTGSASEVVPGIRRLVIPTPFPIGPVNAYLIEGEPLILVDSGPNWATAFDALEAALGEAGYRIEDLDLLLVSHEHPDHVGLLRSLQVRSGAEVAALDQLANFIESYDEEVRREDAFAEATMRRHGVPSDIITAGEMALGYGRQLGAGSAVDRRLRDGDLLTHSEGNLRVLHRPGHSRFDTLFLDERGSVVAGDHLIRGLSPNAVVARPLETEVDGRARPVLRYIDSLRTIRELPVEIVLSGHRDPFTDLRGHIDEQLEFHQGRAEEIYRVLAGCGPASVHDLARILFGQLALSQSFPAVSEVLGHLDLLVASGAVRALCDDDVVRFEVSAQRPLTASGDLILDG